MSSQRMHRPPDFAIVLAMAQAQPKPMSLAQFLDWEERQSARYEFVDGTVVMMAGGTAAHDSIRLAIASTLRAKLAGGRCRVHLDLKLVCPNGRSRYPDVAVVCGPPDPKATQLVDPVVLVEVLSPSTRASDYIVKSSDYSSVPSVAVYLLVDPDQRHIDVVRRVGGTLQPPDDESEPSTVIELPEIGVTLSLDEIYGA